MSIAPKGQNTPVLHRTGYDRDRCKVGIVHIGYGAFHRAHQAIYIDDYMENTGDLRWGIAAVNLRSEETLAFARSKQVSDGYLIKTTDVDGMEELRLVRSHLSYTDWSSTPDVAEQLLAGPDVHLVTITITESGYYLDGNGNLDLCDPAVSEEINRGQTSTIYGFLATALHQRMSTTGKPISILCCDNIRSNGKMLRRNLLSYLQAKGQTALSEWISENVSFPCSMVDRITPRATPELLGEITSLFGTHNLDPIHAEAFTQWVLEDNFAGPFPDLTKAGVEIVPDVDPYEEAKIRILNGGHTALAYLGALAGYTTFDEAMRDPLLHKHFQDFETQEVLPGLQLELPFDKQDYLQKISGRFGNRAIADQLERICMDGFSKMQLYIRPTLESCLQQGIKPVHAYDCIASWYVYARRFKLGETSIPYHEPYWEQLSPLLELGKETDFASNKQLWGELPAAYPEFLPALLASIKQMEKSWPA